MPTIVSTHPSLVRSAFVWFAAALRRVSADSSHPHTTVNTDTVDPCHARIKTPEDAYDDANSVSSSNSIGALTRIAIPSVGGLEL